jgi:tetratricopeptide (TPR) repeat protein
MKKILIILVIVFCKTNGFSQTKKAEPAKQKADEHAMQAQVAKDSIPDEIKVYHMATSFADYDVAKHAIFTLIARNPDRIDYLDSLARIYFSMNAYPQALAAADFVLKSQPDNLQMLELSAICQNAMKNEKEALTLYEKLYGKTKSVYHLYQIAVLQYSLQRNGECNKTIETILADKDALTQKIQISYDEENAQSVPLAAAAYNLRGVMEKDMKENDKAKKDFEEAIKVYPEFQLAKNNLDMMNKPAESADKEKVKKK